ncbi:MAG: T9SS type A sorting domain-containing protein [Bacteroidetes bacterium]|nr:T9SS type A sorting domain-containing protein [Bacteroidota bacterium]
MNNGSFEEYYDCSIFFNSLQQAKYWLSIDSLTYNGRYIAVCNGKVPLNGTGYQYPKTGNAYVASTFYWINAEGENINRGYLKNRLKSTLQAGKTYCVKFHISITNESTYGMDGFGVYFGGSEIDTITKCTIPLSYITPQIQNPQGNIITDTLNWVVITGTFTANGTEKYALIGNFLAHNNVDTLMINTTHLPMIYTDITIDDVSCIPVDLEAYAGRDTTILYGDSVYIGREKDFATDPYCVWYKLPDTANAIDTTSGLWVKPSVTTTYVVKQELECSPLKWDTVVVNVKNDVGLQELIANSRQFAVEMFPNPASDMITVKTDKYREEISVSVFDVTGKTVLNKKVAINNYVTGLELNLGNGIYTICFTDKVKKMVTKKLVVAK